MATVAHEGTAPDLEYIRLHITPLNPSLLSAILTPSAVLCARNISYHSVQTFPEKSFGFVELPRMEAHKIKKKLSGSILKGTKIEIEEARPSKLSKRIEETSDLAEKTHKSKSGRSGKRKRDDDTLQGVELKGRKVKRGWTDSSTPVKHGKALKDRKNKKEPAKSKYTSGPECLFRTSLPPNAGADSKERSAEEVDTRTERRKRRKSGQDTVVHEFTKTTKYASFLRESGTSSKSNTVAEFVEGKGWLDQDGTVVEEATYISGKVETKKGRGTNKTVVGDRSDSGEDESKDKSTSARRVFRNITLSDSTKKREDDSSTSSSATSKESESETDSDSTSRYGDAEGIKTTSEKRQPLSSSSTPIGLAIEIPGEVTTESATVHPLEALYKRRRPDVEGPKQQIPTFSFFEDDANVEGEDSEDPTPMTPFTREDFISRALRSAAPTPDTAYPHKSYTSWPTDQPEDDRRSTSNTPINKQSSTSDPSAGSSSAPIGDFQKWFYEHQGEANRGWKKQRKMAAKEKRQRENRKRGDRPV